VPVEVEVLVEPYMLEVLDFHNADGDGVQVVEAAAATPPHIELEPWADDDIEVR